MKGVETTNTIDLRFNCVDTCSCFGCLYYNNLDNLRNCPNSKSRLKCFLFFPTNES